MPKKKERKTGRGKKPESESKKAEERKEEAREEIIEEMNRKLDKEEKKEEKEVPPKKQIRKENKIFAVFVGILLLMAAVFAAYLIFSKAATTFTYNGVSYSISKYGTLTFYDTKIPVLVNGTSRVDYSIFIRNDPRMLDKEVPFNGTLYIRPALVINYTDELGCNGYETISLANMDLVYRDIGTQVLLVNQTTNPQNLGCDPQQRYVFINLLPSNKTEVQEIAPACYNIYVSDCQIVQGTERYLTATFETINNYTRATNSAINV